MAREGETDLEAAAARLQRAIAAVEARLATLRRQAQAGAAAVEAGGLVDRDRAALAAALDESEARRRALEEAGVAASAALGRAIATLDLHAEQPRADEGVSVVEGLDDAPPADVRSAAALSGAEDAGELGLDLFGEDPRGEGSAAAVEAEEAPPWDR